MSKRIEAVTIFLYVFVPLWFSKKVVDKFKVIVYYKTVSMSWQEVNKNEFERVCIPIYLYGIKGELKMAQVAVETKTDQIYEIVTQLNQAERIKLVQRLDELTWKERFESLLTQIDRKIAKKHISEEEILKEVEDVRRRRYARSYH